MSAPNLEPAPTRETAADSAVRRTIRFLDEMLGVMPHHVGVRLWSGRRWPDEKPRAATLVLQHPGALAAMFSAGTETALAEAYIHDDVDIEGDIESVFDFGDALLARLDDWKERVRLAGLFLLLPEAAPRANGVRSKLTGSRHSPERDRAAVSFHYDLSNEFYQLWLDHRMVYSCAYFNSPNDGIDQAQEQKLDYLCQKLRLQPGQSLLDIGCGWGGLILRAAERFGVRATGVTLSERQAEWVLRRIAAHGAETKAKVRLCDYRQLGDDQYDAIVSVGMAEHVGREQLSNYFSIARDLLKPGGVFLNHAIGEGMNAPAKPDDDSFIARYVFPDGDIPPLPIMLKAAESGGFEIRDVENLREHYALTLHHWLRRLEAQHTAARAFVSEESYRVWRLYLAGSGHAFRRGRIAVYQTLLAKLDESGRTNLPLTRGDWYA